ncbi:CLUMA_CG002207, isoform A [Clunio marinus]|uniref:Polyprenal reductase n=1 Tax=Clunio marinus TaxID=568069 RepID=A0A1J1HQM6_9DIPT|nr:CLUMA_CG002207, isoform A [Clunio marinus]
MNINLINILFMQLTFVIVVLGTLMSLVEKYLPTAIKQTFRYGKHAHKEKSDKLVEKIEIPKAWFSHFYVFAVIWAWGALILVISVYFYGYQPCPYLINYLNLSCGDNRIAETSPFITLIALSLMTLQCTRRFIETNFLQIFSKKSKINLTHYLCGYLHYYGVIVLIVAKADGFINGQTTPVMKVTLNEALRAIVAILTFIYFWYKQYESNLIFINLRKNKSGNVVTETHLIPKGGLFKYLSSPHMTCEVFMYLILYFLLHQNTSCIYCLAWVVTNQFSNSLLTHRWYKETFSDYPKERKAFIPFLF